MFTFLKLCPCLVMIDGVMADNLKNLLFFGLHLCRILGNTVFMIIPKKVQEAMNKEKKNLVFKTYVFGLRVTHGRFHGNHNISQ